MNRLSKITLGTAQLGMHYGIANTVGKPSFNNSIELLKFAWKNGISSFDTSPTYGNSEEIIGSFISSHLKDVPEKPIIISKLPKIEDDTNLSYESLFFQIKKQINESIDNLNVEKIPIYLIHHPADIFLKDGIVVECLSQLKSEGLIDNIGISVYNPNEVRTALDFKELNVIQVPINIFDNRLTKLGLLKELKNKKYTIFDRSIYLQGLFFKNPEQLPNNLEIARDALLKLINITKNIIWI